MTMSLLLHNSRARKELMNSAALYGRRGGCELFCCSQSPLPNRNRRLSFPLSVRAVRVQHRRRGRAIDTPSYRSVIFFVEETDV